MTNRILFLAFLAVFAGCEHMEEKDGQKNEVTVNAPQSVTASFNPLEKRAHLEGYTVEWIDTDAISLFPESDAQHKYVFDAFKDETDKATALFRRDRKISDATIEMDKTYALFPYRPDDNKLSAEGVLTTRIKNTQDNFGDDALRWAPMVAVSDNDGLEFINVASVIRFNVKKSADFTEDCVLNTIVLRSKTQNLTGLMEIDTNAEVWTAVPSGENAKNAVSKKDNGSTVLTTEPKPFCIVIAPGTYPAEDLSVTMTYNDTEEKVIVINRELAIGPNKIQDIDCTITPSGDLGLSVTTGDIFEYNGHQHLTCYTATVTGTVTGEGADEVGVIYQRTGTANASGLIYSNVGGMGNSSSDDTATNRVTKAVSSSVSGDIKVKLNNLAGGNAASTYIYRVYVIRKGGISYGEVKSFRTDVYDSYVEVAGGTFTMGADSGQPGYDIRYGTSPAHTVSVSDFEIGRYEVTVEQFVKFLNEAEAVCTANSDTELTAKLNNTIVYSGRNKDSEQMSLEYKDGKWGPKTRKKFVMERVTLAGAEAYCSWLTQSRNDGYTYRVPTEAEWEFAARGGNSANGFRYSGSNTSADVAVSKGTNAWSSLPLPGTKYPNELGIYDMSGSLWEWVSDISDITTYSGTASEVQTTETTSYFKWCLDNHPLGIADPKGPDASQGVDKDGKAVTCYVTKGGSCNESDKNAAFVPAFRRNDRKGKTYSHVAGGFRVVRTK